MSGLRQNFSSQLVLAILLAIVLGLGVDQQKTTADEIQQINELGPVKVTTTLSPEKPVIGDEIQLEIKVESQANVEVLMPEFGEALNRYTILDFVPRQRIADDGSNVSIQRYTLQPDSSGQQSITPILIEFIDNRPNSKPTPDDADAYEVLTDRIDFEVASVLPSEAANELKPPLGELEPPRDFAASNMKWLVPLMLLVTGALVAAGIYFRRHRKKVVRRSAYEIARRRLDQLLKSGLPNNENEIENFFVKISSIVRKYLEDRFEFHAPDLTTEEFLELASKSRELTDDHQKLLRGFLKQADLVKFAGLRASAEEIEKSRDAAARFLEDTRENAPLIQDPAELADDPLNSGAVTEANREEANV